MNNKYSILVVANESYIDLLRVYLKSLFANIDKDKLQNLIVADTGLSEKSKNWISKFNNKIKIIETKQNIQTTQVHSKEWVEAVSVKTQILLEVVQDAKVPVILMDIDMIVLEDFSNVIDSSYDMQFCRIANPEDRPDMTLDYIASFFVVNTKSAIKFIEDWIVRIQERIAMKTRPAFETPALNELIKLNKHDLRIGDLDENIVSCDNNYHENITKIIHVKSRTADDGISLKRLKNIKNYNLFNIIKYLEFNEKISLLFGNIVFNKVKDLKTGRRRIYFCGMKIFSYKRHKRLDQTEMTEFDKIYAKRFDPDLTLEGKKEILSALFFKSLGYTLNWENPTTFNEKLQWLKINYENPLIGICADKVTAPEYFMEKTGTSSEHIVQNINIYKSVNEIDFSLLPKSFVLKSNWGSGAQIIVKDKNIVDEQNIISQMENWLDRTNNHYYSSLEPGYRDIQPKIICEELLDFEYKLEIFCFDGEPKFFWIIFGDKTEAVRANFYTLDWTQMPLNHKYPNFTDSFNKPQDFFEIVESAKKASKDFPHVRVDFFIAKSGYKFSELTFFHWAGLTPMTPPEWDKKLGEMIILPGRSTK